MISIIYRSLRMRKLTLFLFDNTNEFAQVLLLEGGMSPRLRRWQKHELVQGKDKRAFCLPWKRWQVAGI